jgi:hypothetical protein
MLLKKFLSIFFVSIVGISTVFLFLKILFPVTVANISMNAGGFVPYQPLEVNIHTGLLKKVVDNSSPSQDNLDLNSSSEVSVIFVNNTNRSFKEVEIKFTIESDIDYDFYYHRHGKYDFTPKEAENNNEYIYHFGPLERGELKIADFYFIAKELGSAVVKTVITADKKIAVEPNTVELESN